MSVGGAYDFFFLCDKFDYKTHQSVEQIVIVCFCGFHIFIQDEFLGHRSASTSSFATSLMDDTSPESALGKKSEF